MAGQIIHSEKLFQGRKTAEQIHRELAWGKNVKCEACGAPPAARIQTFVLLTDMSLHTQMAILFEVSQKRLHLVKFVAGQGVRTGVVHPCSSCLPSAERAAARGPSYAIVDIDRGPGPDAPIVQVVSSL